MFMNRLLIRNIVMLLLWVPAALAGGVRIGQLAPKLIFGRMIQGQFDSVSSGKPLLLEFWATWCGPCVANIPHLNQLAEQFEPRGVEFVSITSEDANTVERFLKTHPMRGIVALDSDQRQ